ncbi:MAG TPA: hypothetical protein VJP59_05840 [Gemmatimonadota bacterium]|nr:hypothetical protein [Gemmatimonadota bacterium]
MRALADHYGRMVELHPGAPLLVLFDIDGTILDMRHMVRYVLQAYDHAHGTAHFRDLELGAIRTHEDSLEVLLDAHRLPSGTRQSVLRWYLRHRWSADAIRASHRPFAGVMEVIRWFQIQPDTFVGLNTGRPEWLRSATLHSLNSLGREYKVQFSSGLLKMNPHGWNRRTAEAKAAAVEELRQEGYRIVAMIDNEPENLRAVRETDPGGEILLLHADTIFKTRRSELPEASVSGRMYELSAVARRERLPTHVQFVWRGVGTREELASFLESNIRWAEIAVGADSPGSPVLLAPDSPTGPEEPLELRDVLAALARHRRGVRVDLRDGEALPGLVRCLLAAGLPPGDLWVHAPVDRIGPDGFHRLRDRLPGSLLQCPIDPVAGLIPDYPEQGREILERCRAMGVGRFSVQVGSLRLREVLDRLSEWGYESDVRGVGDLESFLRTVLLLPTSVSATFRFPGWA